MHLCLLAFFEFARCFSHKRRAPALSTNACAQGSLNQICLLPARTLLSDLGESSRPFVPTPLKRRWIRTLLQVKDIGAMDLESAEVLTRSGNHLQLLWIQAPLPQVIESVVIAAKQESVATPVTTVITYGNYVRCLNYFWRGIAQAATLFPVATKDCCSKCCLTAFLELLCFRLDSRT